MPDAQSINCLEICDSHDLVRVCITFVSTAHILAKTKKKVKKIRLKILIFAIK